MRREHTNAPLMLFDTYKAATVEADNIVKNNPGTLLGIAKIYVFNNHLEYKTQQIINPNNPATALQAKQIINDAQGKSLIEREEILSCAATKYELLIQPVCLN